MVFRLNLSTQAQRYLRSLEQEGYRPVTVMGLRSQLDSFVKWSMDRGIEYPDEFTEPLAKQYQRYWYDYRKARDGASLSFRSQNHRLAAAQGLFRWLQREKVVAGNPFEYVRYARLDLKLPRAVMNLEQMAQVLALPDIHTLIGVRDRALLELLYATGVRRNEIRSLQLYDVDWEQGRLTLRQTKGRMDRIVPVSSRAMEWLDKYVREVRGRWLRADTQAVFLTQRGTQISLDTLTDTASRYMRLAGLKEGACHAFRHSSATHMLEGGADIRFIQEFLGHSDLNSTKVYTRVSKSKLTEVYARTHPSAREKLLSETDALHGLSS